MKIIKESDPKYFLPTLEEFKKNYIEENKEYEGYDNEEHEKRKEFFRDWFDYSIEGFMWDIMSDHTSEGFNEDEDYHLEQFDDNDKLWVEVAENFLKSMIQITRNNISDEEILARMNPKKKANYDKLKEQLEKIKVAVELK
jgi:hypothetical protein